MNKNAWFFDIDGVLTNPELKKVPKKLIKEISKLLDNGEFVAFVTGRSLIWTKERVTNQLIGTNLENVFISAEKGGVWSFYRKGKWFVDLDKRLAPPAALKKKIENLVKREFSNIMFFDPKETMISVEMRDGMKIVDFAKPQARLNVTLNQQLKNSGLDKKFNIDFGNIAIDVQNKKAGKGLGASRVLTYLQKIKIVPAAFFAFGDMGSDVEIAQEIYKNGKSVKFIFTGEEKLLNGKGLPFQTFVYDKQYEQGTLKFLKTHDT